MHILLVLAYSDLILFFFFNYTTATQIYPLSLHDALPISNIAVKPATPGVPAPRSRIEKVFWSDSMSKIIGIDLGTTNRSEEHTSELQSRPHLVCRLLLEKKKKKKMLHADYNTVCLHTGIQ